MLSEYVDTQTKERAAMWIHSLPVVSLALPIRLVYVPMAFFDSLAGPFIENAEKRGPTPCSTHLLCASSNSSYIVFIY